MVDVDSHKKNKKNEEDDVWVINHGGVMIEVDFKHGEGSGKKLDENIKKLPHPPPNFDVSD
jgi:hypothetical protein